MKTVNSCIVPSFLSWLVLLLVSAVASLAAPEWKGAKAVLEIVADQSGKKDAPANISEAGKLRADVEAFGKAGGALPPDDAAKQWLALMDRFFALPAQARSAYEAGEFVSVEQVIGALPPPAAWGSLAVAVSSRPAARKEMEWQEAGLRLLVAALTGDRAMREREIQFLHSRAENASRSEAYLMRSLFDGLNEALLETADDPDAMLRSLERRLARAVTEQRGPGGLRLPNLVALVGEEKTSTFLRKALTTNVMIEVHGDDATSRLAQRLALELVEEMKTPQWHLVNSLDSVELFEALDKKFAKPKPAAPEPDAAGLLDVRVDFDPRDYVRSRAETYYLLGLIGKGRAKEAVAVAQRLAKGGRPSLPDEARKAMERAGYTRALDDFFFELLTQDGSLPYWDEYVQLAAKAGRTERMLTLARSTAASDSITKKKRASIHQNLFRALLADGQVEEGVGEIKRLLALEPGAGAEISQGQLGLTLARLGSLLKNADWTAEGISAARSSLTNVQGRWDWFSRSVPAALATLLWEENRGAEAEAILADTLARTVRESAGRDEMMSGEDGAARPLLMALASLYHRANRPADVLALLDGAPYWGAKDMADLLEESSTRYAAFLPVRMQVRDATEELPVAYVAASALATLNRAEEARVLNNALLEAQPGYDRAYELLLKLDGDNSIARLEGFFSRDQFEERPLIWKARVLADRREFAAAEEVVRRAISIDPSDGEQGPGDRMRAYAVLADIREARGDQKDAEFFRSVVKAIRLSEEADTYYAVGLLKRAVAMYEESLKHFADAYCIQSRLAVQLAELGQHDQAEAHYRRAYELMPDSFGRVESHCFGCEKAFDGPRAQSVAERVFTELAVRQPRKPQVHYLLGYLRAEQDRHAESIPHFKAAVFLDPEYLNAWEKLIAASRHVRMPAQERDLIVFNLLRLDPMQRHTHPDLRHVADLAALWNAVENADKVRPARPASLYALAASKAAMEKKQENSGNQRRNRFRGLYGHEEDRLTPGVAVAQTTFVRSAAQLLNYVSYEE